MITLAWKQTQAGLAPLPLHCAAFSGSGDNVFVGGMSGRVRQYTLPAASKLEYQAEAGAHHLGCACWSKCADCITASACVPHQYAWAINSDQSKI